MKKHRGLTPGNILITEKANRFMDRQEKRFRRRLPAYFAAMLSAGALSLAPSQVAAQQDLRYVANLNGANGFRLPGEDGADVFGGSVSGAGDVNGDGFADVIVGAVGAHPGSPPTGSNPGAVYVLFGKPSGSDYSESVANLDGTKGFHLIGAGVSQGFGTSVSAAGDVNGDGFDDIMVGAIGAVTTYVVFGKASGFASPIDMSTLAEPDGFRLVGTTGERFGNSVSGAGDINGDGFDDMIIGAPRASNNGSFSGSSYLVFGKQSGFSSPMNMPGIAATDGFRLDGNTSDGAGISVAGAGDVNGDGFDDVIVGAYLADTLRNSVNAADTGAAYVVFGKASGFSPTGILSQLDGSTGFRLNGNKFTDHFGFSVAGAGDINGDGFAEIIVGAPLVDIDSTYRNGGMAYVVFGKAAGFSPASDASVLNGTEGFTLKGPVANEEWGRSVSGAGDINADGYAELIVGGRNADNYGFGPTGASAVVYGKPSGFFNLNFGGLYYTGFSMVGNVAGDRLGNSVSGVGDYNADGFGDFILGAPGADSSGVGYVVFGSGPATGTSTFKGRSRPGDAPPVEPGSAGDGSVSPSPSRARIDFTGGTTISQEIVAISRGTSGTVTNLSEESTADVVWQITTDRADFGTAAVTLTYRDSEIARVGGVPESSLTMYKSEVPGGPWVPLATTVDTAKNEATASVTEFSYFLLGDSAGLPVGLTQFQMD